MGDAKYPHLYAANKATFKDRGITKAAELIKPWQEQDGTVEGIALVGAPLSKPSISHSGASFAPGTIRKMLSSCTTYAIEDDLDLADEVIHDFGDIMMHVTDLAESDQRIEQTLQTLYSEHPQMIPIVLGGDHSVSAPSLKAFTRARGTIGVIQFDAHHDLRNTEDGGPSNGTPFRRLIDGKAIAGQHLIQIGIRNFANGKMYKDFADAHDITVYPMKAVHERSIVDIINESIASLQHKVDHIYVSVDMDVLDQAFAPGCPAIGPGGMDSYTLLTAVELLAQCDKVTGMDIVEIDPTVDFRDMTSRVAAHVIMAFLKGKKK